MNQSDIKRVAKDWGSEEWLVMTSFYTLKKLNLSRGKRCSLHYHDVKDETFFIESGKVLMEAYKEERIMGPGEKIRICPGTKHRFSGLEDSVIIEVSTHHDDRDSYRTEGQLSGDVPKEIMDKYEGK